MIIMMETAIILASNACSMEYPTNKLSFFRNSLPRHHDLQGGTWKVALQALTTTATFQSELTIATAPFTIYICKKDFSHGVEILLPRSSFSAHAIYHYLAEEFEKINVSPAYFGQTPLGIELKNDRLLLTISKVQFLIDKTFFDAMRFKWVGGPRALGLSRWVSVQDGHKYVRFDTTKSNASFVVDNVSENLLRNIVHRLPKRIHVKLHELYPCLSSDTNFEKVLATITLSSLKKVGNSYWFEVENKEYHKIQNSSVLTVELTDEHHERVAFADGQSTFLKLKFIPTQHD